MKRNIKTERDKFYSQVNNTLEVLGFIGELVMVLLLLVVVCFWLKIPLSNLAIIFLLAIYLLIRFIIKRRKNIMVKKYKKQNLKIFLFR